MEFVPDRFDGLVPAIAVAPAMREPDVAAFVWRSSERDRNYLVDLWRCIESMSQVHVDPSSAEMTVGLGPLDCSDEGRASRSVGSSWVRLLCPHAALLLCVCALLLCVAPVRCSGALLLRVLLLRVWGPWYGAPSPCPLPVRGGPCRRAPVP